MPEYHFTSRLPSSETSGKVYRMEFHAVVASGSEEIPEQLTLSLDDFGSTFRGETPLEELPQLLFGEKLAQSFILKNNLAYTLKLDLSVAANKVIALDIVERLLSFKDLKGLGDKTNAAFIISELASNMQKCATNRAGHVASSQTIYHDLFALYQTLGGTRTLADFEAQAPVQPPAGFGMGAGPSLFTASSTPREERGSEGCCCRIM